MPDIKQLLKSSGINAERTATELFGNAVEDFASGPINRQLKGLFGVPEGPQPVNRNDGSWYSTSYAHSLANSQFRPKLKFLFRVEFLFKPEVLAQFGAQSAEWAKNFAFMIKSVDRPKVDFEYDEINQYNFRTKVLKQIKHRALTMTFMDDVGNNVHEFFRFMMMVHSPITRRSIGASFDISSAYARYSAGSGMKFSNSPTVTNDFAHRGAVGTDIGNVIQAIKVTQMFMQPGKTASDLDNGAKEVAFFFINPRIESFDLDDVNHETSDVNLFTMSFDYDFMVMSDMRTLQPVPAGKGMPPVGSAPGEASPTGRRPGDPKGSNNPYIAALSAIGGRAATKLTNELLGSKIRRIPGLGSVADTLGGLVGGAARNGVAGGLGSLGSMVGGALGIGGGSGGGSGGSGGGSGGSGGGSSGGFLGTGGLGGFVNQAFARPTKDLVTDGSTAGRDPANSTNFNPGGP